MISRTHKHWPISQGMFAIAKATAGSSAFSLVREGDSVSAVNKAGVADRINHISMGGGTSLEFLEGKKLPGIGTLRRESWEDYHSSRGIGR